MFLPTCACRECLGEPCDIALQSLPACYLKPLTAVSKNVLLHLTTVFPLIPSFYNLVPGTDILQSASRHNSPIFENLLEQGATGGNDTTDLPARIFFNFLQQGATGRRVVGGYRKLGGMTGVLGITVTERP